MSQYFTVKMAFIYEGFEHLEELLLLLPVVLSLPRVLGGLLFVLMLQIILAPAPY